MLRAASKVLLRTQGTTTGIATRYASIPCYHGYIRSCSSLSPFLGNGIGLQQKLIEQHSNHGANTLHQTAGDEEDGDFCSPQGRNATLDQNVVSMEETEVAESSQVYAEVVECGTEVEAANIQAVADETVCLELVAEGVMKGHGEVAESGSLVQAQVLKLVVGGDAKVAARTVKLNPEYEDATDLPVKMNDGKKGVVEGKHENNAEERLLAPEARVPRHGLNVAIDPILMQPQAISMLRKLGLHKFVQTPLPRAKKQLCDEFLASYVHRLHSSRGTVHGKTVTITPEAVHRVTGLPLGVKPIERRKTHGKYVSSLGARVYKNCYNLKTVKLSENEEENRVLVALAELLTKRMGLFPGKAAGPILWGVRESWHGETEVQWAAYMAELLIKKAERLTGVDRGSKYGRWLTAVIEDSLGKSDDKMCKNEDKVKLEQMEQKKRMLEAKSKEIKKREQKVQKLYARCSRFAKSMIVGKIF